MTDERKAYYWLSSSGLSLSKQYALLDIYGKPSEIADSVGSEKLREFCGKCYKRMKQSADESFLDKELYALKKKGIKLLIKGYGNYPVKFAECEDKTPLVFYAKGNDALLSEETLAVVGSRASTDYGRTVASSWSETLCRRFVIVSGHATGIDTYAVKSCIGAGGSAIVVLACGHDKYVLPDFLKNAEDRYLLLSAYSPSTPAGKYVYGERNRVISGISDGVLIVEAGEKSGALITAKSGAEQNKPVFVVPGSVLSTRSAGTNGLLRHGAIAVTSPYDVEEDLGYEPDFAKSEKRRLTGDRKKVADMLGKGNMHFDDIASALGISPADTAELLGEMELDGIVERKMFNYYSLSVR